MHIAELQNRYGYELADQVQRVLKVDEFRNIDIEELANFLELRAERIYQEYQQEVDNTPILATEREKIKESLNSLRRRWQEAEELAYHILAADAKNSVAERRALPGA